MIKVIEIIDEDEMHDKLIIVMEYCKLGQIMTWHVHDDYAHFVPYKSLESVSCGGKRFMKEE